MTSINEKKMNQTVYNDKIQMIMDFLKLSFIIDNPKSSLKQKKESFTLQKNLLNIIKNNNSTNQYGGSFTNNNKLANICSLLEEIYEKNKQLLNN